LLQLQVEGNIVDITYQKLQKLNILQEIRYDNDADGKKSNESDESQRIAFTRRLRVVFLTTRKPENVSFKILLDGNSYHIGHIPS